MSLLGLAVRTLWQLVLATRERWALRHRVQPVFQMSAQDCGAACLLTSLGIGGLRLSREELSERLPVGRGGSSAFDMVAAARSFGAEARGLRLKASQLRGMRAGTILHWERGHFVVLLGRTDRRALIFDPALGRRRLPWSTIESSFGGVALDVSVPPQARTGSRVGTRGQSESTRLWRTVVGEAKRMIWPVLGLGLVAQGTSLVVPFFVRRLVVVGVDSAVGANTAISRAATALVLLVVVFGAWTSFLRSLLLVRLERRIDMVVSPRLVRHYVDLPLLALATRRKGEVLQLIRSVGMARRELSRMAATLLAELTIALAGVIAIGVIAPTMLFVVGLVVAVIGMVLVIGNAALSEAADEVVEAQIASQGRLAEIVLGVETLKGAGLEVEAADEWAVKYEAEANAFEREGNVLAAVDTLLLLPRVGAFLGVLAAATYGPAWLDTDLADALAVSLIATQVIGPVAVVGSDIARWSTIKAALERARGLLDTRTEAQAGGGAVLSSETPPGIVAAQLAFTYPGERVPTVRGVDVSVKPGRILGIAGPSGSGKSTLARLMCGLYPLGGGTLTVDGLDATACAPNALRRVVAYLGDGSQIFSDTIRENVVMGRRGISDEEVAQALAVACIDEDVARLPLGLDTYLPSGGGVLSAGQRQRVCIARVLASRPAYVVFDEATSSIDIPTEGRLLQRLIDRGTGVVLVSHRFATLSRAERVLVITEGCVVAEGPPQDLVEVGSQFMSSIRK